MQITLEQALFLIDSAAGPTRLFKLQRSSDTRDLEEPADPQRCRAAGVGRDEGKNVGLSQENDVKSG